MKIFLLSPSLKTLFTAGQLEKLRLAGDLVLQEKIIPFCRVAGLTTGRENKILAIDPDFCNWRFPNQIIDKIPNLKAIVLQTTSFSWMDGNYLSKKGIPVVNLRGFSSIAVAEWAVMMALVLIRRLPLVIQDGWKQDFVKHQGDELRDKTAGVIGLGNVGTAIAENCRGLGMRVQYWSKNTRDKRFKEISLKALMKTSDIIFPAVAQNDETNGLISDTMLKSMKRTSVFVSVVHRVYNHDLLLDMAKDGRLFGYGFETSKPEFGKFKGNVWAGPELAWCTNESMKKNSALWIEAIINATKNKFPTRIN